MTISHCSGARCRIAVLSAAALTFALMLAQPALAADPVQAAKPATATSAPKAVVPAAKPAAVPAKPAVVPAKATAAKSAAPKTATAPNKAAKKKSGSKKAPPAPKFTFENTIIWRGDLATQRSVVNDIAALYEKTAKIHIEQQAFSTISGLDAVAAGKADMAGSARGAHEGRIEEANLNFIPQALDAIVPMVHPRNPITGLSLRQLRQIYLGRVRNWKEVGGLDAPINLYAVAAPMDGVEYKMRELLYGRGEQRIAAPRLYINTGSMEEGITLDPNALGLSTLSVLWNRTDLKMLSVAGVVPSTATVKDGSYPLYGTLFLVNRVGSPKEAMVDAFLAFAGTPEALQIMRNHHLVPMADVEDAVARNQTRLAFIESELAREPVPVPGSSPGVDVTPVSAPNATAAAKVAVAPGAESTQAAVTRSAIDQAARAADAKQAAINKAATDKAIADKAAASKPPAGKK